MRRRCALGPRDAAARPPAPRGPRYRQRQSTAAVLCSPLVVLAPPIAASQRSSSAYSFASVIARRFRAPPLTADSAPSRAEALQLSSLAADAPEVHGRYRTPHSDLRSQPQPLAPTVAELGFRLRGRFGGWCLGFPNPRPPLDAFSRPSHHPPSRNIFARVVAPRRDKLRCLALQPPPPSQSRSASGAVLRWLPTCGRWPVLDGGVVLPMVALRGRSGRRRRWSWAGRAPGLRSRWALPVNVASLSVFPA